MRRLLTTNEPVLRTPLSRSTWHLLDASVWHVSCRPSVASVGSAASFARREGSGPAASCSAIARSGGTAVAAGGARRLARERRHRESWRPCRASAACRPAQSATTAPRCLRGRAASGERQVRWWVGGWHPCSERPRAAGPASRSAQTSKFQFWFHTSGRRLREVSTFLNSNFQLLNTCASLTERSRSPSILRRS